MTWRRHDLQISEIVSGLLDLQSLLHVNMSTNYKYNLYLGVAYVKVAGSINLFKPQM